MLTKDPSEPLPSKEALDALPVDGTHPLLDRDDVHDVYAEWRAVLDAYDPPRSAVAEAWVAPARIPLYASSASLGQAFNFDLLEADFDAEQFRRVVENNLALAALSGSSSTWVLSNHDVVRHATRYALPAPGRTPDGRPADRHGREVAEIPAALRQDPTHARSPGLDVGRDGCRVPLPWSSDGPSFGFGSGPAHLPQPQWMALHAVTEQEGDEASTLNLYRRALRLRSRLLAGEDLLWRDTGRPDVLRFARHPGWEVVTNFGATDVPLGGGEVLLSSSPARHDVIPAQTTVWIAPPR